MPITIVTSCAQCVFFPRSLDGVQDPQASTGAVAVQTVLNHFEVSKRRLLESGELSPRTFHDYQRTTARLAGLFDGKRAVASLKPEDFGRLRCELAKTLGPNALSTEIQRVRSVFKLALDDGMLPRPVAFGSTFRKPSRRTLRAARNARGCRVFSAKELRQILAACQAPLRAMVLLGVNCGFGNNDCAKLPGAAVDLVAGWVDYPRPKTAVPRRCPLWPETAAAVREAIARRPAAKDQRVAALCFLTSQGRCWAADASTNSPISKEFGKLLSRLGLKRDRLNFYALRHTFETIGGDRRDQVAVDAIMGHVDGSMGAVYRERVDDTRLRAVTDHIHDWLFGFDS